MQSIQKRFSVESSLLVLAYLILIAWAIVTLLPLIWLYIGAFTPQSQLMSIPPEFSIEKLSFINFIRLFDMSGKDAPIGRWMLNSLLITIVVTLLNILFDTLAGYTLAKKTFPGRRFLFALTIAVMMIPPHAVLVPRFLIMTNWAHKFFALLGLDFTFYDTWAGLIIPAAIAPYGIFLIKQYVQTLPSELEDAARIDGCGEFGVFYRIIVPLTKPAIAVLGILVFVGEWNSYLWPMIMLNDTTKYTIQVGLASMQQQFTTDYGILLSGAALASVPILAVFMFFQKYFIQGLTMGAIKG